MMDSLHPVPWGVVVAAIGGLAIGVERQWSGHAVGPLARFAGVRTFTLLGGLGGLAGWLWSGHIEALAIVVLSAGAALIVAAYVAGSRVDVDGTTEVSALVVLSAGAVAGLGHLAMASGIVALTGIILLEKTRLHALVERLDDDELRAAMRFAVMAVVVLPLLPVGPYGPFGTVRPRDLWMFVLFFSGLSFAAYVARRLVGAGHGYTLAGALGGLISSTTMTLTLARASRDAAANQKSLAYGALAASTVLFARVLAAVTVLNPALVMSLAMLFALPFAVGATMVVAGLRSIDPASTDPAGAPHNPLQFRAALLMALVFQAVLIATTLAHRFWGDMGITVAAALLGLTDVDALTLSMARSGETVPSTVAVQAIAVGILTNTALKLAIAAAIGRGTFRRVTISGLAAMALALGTSLLVGAVYR
jgi:uncharacterized membrane protein (DUF4010 family)